MRTRRVLLVEDEVLIAIHTECMLIDFGFEVVGPAMRLKSALAIAREESFDLAVLDVNLADERSFPVADVLRERGIPFIFVTGYGSAGIADDYKGTITLRKPLEPGQLENAIARLQ